MPKAPKKKKAARPFDVVCDMENDLETARLFAAGLAMIAETLDDGDGAVVQRVAWAIMDNCKALEERRGRLFHMLHPNAEHRKP